MAALPPSDVFAVERQRLESAAAELRCLLAEKQQQLSEQCAKCAHEEEKLLRSKYLSEFKEISTQKEAMKEKLKKHMDGLEQQEMDLECAEERKKTVAEYQSRLQTESSRNDLLARISQLKAKQRGATEALKSQMSHVMKTHQAEEAKLSQQLRLREEDFARNEEECATSNAQGMTLQEHLAADLKHQLSASQEKVATFEVSLESMQALILQKEMKVEEMIQSCDIGLKQKAAERDFSEKEKSELKEREKSLEAATRQMKRLDEAESLTKDLENQLKTSGLAMAEISEVACPDKAPEELIEEKIRLQAQVVATTKGKNSVEAEVKELEEELRRLQRNGSEQCRTGDISNALSECEMQAKDLRSRIWKLQSDPKTKSEDQDLMQLQMALDAKGRRLRMLSSMVQDMPREDS